MTKPTKSTTSDKTGEKAVTKPKTDTETKSETLKLKKEAAKPDTFASKDIGAGSGAEAAAGGGEVKPIESNLVGSSKGSTPAAVSAKPASQTSANKDNSDKPILAAPPEKPKDADKNPSSLPATGTVRDNGVSKQSAVEKMADEKLATEKAVPAKSGSSTAPAQNVTVHKTGFWRVVSGGVVAAGLGAAATIWALPHLPAGWLPEEPVQEAAVDAEAIKADAVAAAEEAARKIVEESASGAAAPAEDIQAALDAQEERIAALETAAGEVTAPAEETPAETPTASAPSTLAETETPEVAQTPVTDGNMQQVIAELQKQLEDQAVQIDELAARPSLDPQATAKVIALADRVDAVQQQIGAAQAETEKLQAAAQESTKRAEAVAAIASLQAALEKGVTPEKAQQTLEAAGIDTPEAFAAEVPSLESLQAGFGDASRAALRATRSDGSAGSGNMLTNFLRSQTGARSVEPREGDDPDAILSRANASVESGDIAAALEEMAALPDMAKNAPAMAEWLSGANAYKDAAAALSDLSAPKN